jgi:hypothetical protein
MKTVGIALLFGLCCLIGIRIAAKKTAPLREIRTVLNELRTFSDRVSGGATLSAAAEQGGGPFSEMLSAYLKALSDGMPQPEAADRAVSRFRDGAAVCHGAELFVNGLSEAPRGDLPGRIEAFRETLVRAEREAEETAKQARVLKSAGFLIGTGLAILLL